MLTMTLHHMIEQPKKNGIKILYPQKCHDDSCSTAPKRVSQGHSSTVHIHFFLRIVITRNIAVSTTLQQTGLQENVCLTQCHMLHQSFRESRIAKGELWSL